MGSVGKSNNIAKSMSMSFQDAEQFWAEEFPDKSNPKYEAMRQALSKEIENPDTDYPYRVFRGLDISDLNTIQDIREKFKVGTIISNTNDRDFTSWSSRLEGAQEYADYGSTIKDSNGNPVHVVLLAKSVQGSVELPGTRGSMWEVLARGSNQYKVTGIREEKQSDSSLYGAHVYYIEVEQVNNKRRKK